MSRPVQNPSGKDENANGGLPFEENIIFRHIVDPRRASFANETGIHLQQHERIKMMQLVDDIKTMYAALAFQELERAFDDPDGDFEPKSDDALNDTIAKDPNFQSAIKNYQNFIESLKGGRDHEEKADGLGEISEEPSKTALAKGELEQETPPQDSQKEKKAARDNTSKSKNKGTKRKGSMPVKIDAFKGTNQSKSVESGKLPRRQSNIDDPKPAPSVSAGASKSEYSTSKPTIPLQDVAKRKSKIKQIDTSEPEDSKGSDIKGTTNNRTENLQPEVTNEGIQETKESESRKPKTRTEQLRNPSESQPKENLAYDSSSQRRFSKKSAVPTVRTFTDLPVLSSIPTLPEETIQMNESVKVLKDTDHDDTSTPIDWKFVDKLQDTSQREISSYYADNRLFPDEQGNGDKRSFQKLRSNSEKLHLMQYQLHRAKLERINADRVLQYPTESSSKAPSIRNIQLKVRRPPPPRFHASNPHQIPRVSKGSPIMFELLSRARIGESSFGLQPNDIDSVGTYKLGQKQKLIPHILFPDLKKNRVWVKKFH
ncbi:MAG: hypothetical protein SGCHY_001392 [Lobulomycetales sp.]